MLLVVYWKEMGLATFPLGKHRAALLECSAAPGKWLSHTEASASSFRGGFKILSIRPCWLVSSPSKASFSLLEVASYLENKCPECLISLAEEHKSSYFLQLHIFSSFIFCVQLIPLNNKSANFRPQLASMALSPAGDLWCPFTSLFCQVLRIARGCSCCHLQKMPLPAPSADPTHLCPQTPLLWKRTYHHVCSYPEWLGYSSGLCKMDRFAAGVSASLFFTASHCLE